MAFSSCSGRAVDHTASRRTLLGKLVEDTEGKRKQPAFVDTRALNIEDSIVLPFRVRNVGKLRNRRAE